MAPLQDDKGTDITEVSIPKRPISTIVFIIGTHFSCIDYDYFILFFVFSACICLYMLTYISLCVYVCKNGA